MPQILVVEDNPSIRDSLGDLFTVEGYDVMLAGDGQDALTRLEAGATPCAIVLDLMMPVMDGWQFLDWKLRSAFARVPVIVLTALNLDGDVVDLRSRHGVDVLSKTGSIDGLLDRVRTLCLPL